MNSQTEQLLGTLEVLAQAGRRDPIFWETKISGEFNIWNLLKFEVLVKETDLELVFQHWQKMEEWGTPTDMHGDDCEYAPYRSEREDEDDEYEEDWNESIAIERHSLYQQIQQLLTTNFTNIQSYKISSMGRSSFYISIIVAQIVDGRWLCLTPTIPDQVISDEEPENRAQILEFDATIVPEISIVLARLKPLKMYGYYHGGYNYCYQHQISQAIAPTKELAIEQALKSVKSISITPIDTEYKDDANISKFMNECLQARTYYRIAFWDSAYLYEVARTPDFDWLGVRSLLEFEYNP
jgi:hypothetical protein